MNPGKNRSNPLRHNEFLDAVAIFIAILALGGRTEMRGEGILIAVFVPLGYVSIDTIHSSPISPTSNFHCHLSWDIQNMAQRCERMP